MGDVGVEEISQPTIWSCWTGSWQLVGRYMGCGLARAGHGRVRAAGGTGP